MVIKLLTIAMMFLLASCNYNGKKKQEKISKQTKLLTVYNNWQKDKEGCLKLRNEKLAYKLITENNLKNSNKVNFFKIFGKANKTEKISNRQVLIYYFDCVCRNGKLNENGDKCYASFYFIDDILETEEFICE